MEWRRLDALFRKDARTVRYGVTESLYGYEGGGVRRLAAALAPLNLARTRSRTMITAYGRDDTVASTLFHRDTAPGKVGRQMQTWVRFEEGWRVVAAHVSLIEEPADRHRQRLRHMTVVTRRPAPRAASPEMWYKRFQRPSLAGSATMGRPQLAPVTRLMTIKEFLAFTDTRPKGERWSWSRECPS